MKKSRVWFAISLRSLTSYPTGTLPTIHIPFRFEAAILSRILSPVTASASDTALTFADVHVSSFPADEGFVGFDSFASGKPTLTEHKANRQGFQPMMLNSKFLCGYWHSCNPRTKSWMGSPNPKTLRPVPSRSLQPPGNNLTSCAPTLLPPFTTS